MSSLRRLREVSGLTQTQLAASAGVSRQLVGAVETGRHLPRVDAALAIAGVLGVDVADLFATSPGPIDVISGATTADGSLVRVGTVGDKVVTSPVRIGVDGWDAADAHIDGTKLVAHNRMAPGIVVLGCEPGLEALERMLRQRGMGAMAIATSSSAALGALEAGRAHAAVIHGPVDEPSADLQGIDVARIGLATWRVGIAGPPDAAAGWWRKALSGKTVVVQRESGAGVQRAFEAAVPRRVGVVDGPRVGTHLEAARRAVLTGMPAVTIEPAALALGATFHPLDVHVVEMLVDTRWVSEPGVAAALDVLGGRRFQQRLAAVGGYDLARCGTRAA